MIRKYKQRQRMSAYHRVMRKIKIPKKIRTDCWIWQGGTNNAGYGLIRADNENKMVLVHRVMGEHVGLDPEKEIQHTCLQKLCVNPYHLKNGDFDSRKKRLTKKYGKAWMRPKNIYNTCEHCGGTTSFSWFERKHGECYPGMKDKNFTCNKV